MVIYFASILLNSILTSAIYYYFSFSFSFSILLSFDSGGGIQNQNVTKLQDTEDGEPPRKKRGRPPKITTAESSAKQKGQDDNNDDNDDGADSEIQPTTSATSEFAPDGPSTSAAPIPRKRGRPPKPTS